jgi:hypothetical protein
MSNGKLRGLGETDSWKTWRRKSCGTVPLNFLLHVRNCTKWKQQIYACYHSLPTGNYITWLWIYLKVPPPPHTQTSDVVYYLRAEGGFTCNTAEMFFFGPNPPNPTRAKKPGHLLLVYFMVMTSVADPWHFGVDPDPCLWLTDTDSDPSIFFIDLQDANKKLIF